MDETERVLFTLGDKIMTDELTDQNEAGIPASKAELMDQIQREWQALQKTIAEAGEAALVRPGPEKWSPKDHLAHLAIWLQVLSKHYLGNLSFSEAAGVDVSGLGETASVEEVNAAFFEHSKGWSLARVRERLQLAHDDVLTQLQSMSFAGLMQPVDPDDPEQRTLILEVMANTYEHYREHNRIIRDLLSR